MGCAASTSLSVASLDDQEELSLGDLCEWIRSQRTGPVGEALATKCSESGLSASEILLLMDQEALLSSLNSAFSDDERRQALALIQSGRKALRREFRVSLKELPDAMDRAVYVMERFPMVLDPSGQATRFLKYQRGAFLMVGNPSDMAPENLRKHLVGALKHGTWLILDFDTLNTLELDQFFSPECFPREIFSRQAMCRPDVYGKLLRAEDPSPSEFMVSDQFKFVVLCRTEQPPPKTALAMCVLHVQINGSKRDDDPQETSSGENDSLAKVLGVTKEVKRNSVEMVEAAFDNDLDTVKKCLDKNYDVDSADGHGHTALSEASCQGHNELVEFLLGKGADPNRTNDERRSALYRAAYNGHIETVQLLLASGADLRVATKQSETAFDVAKTPAIQEMIQGWDITKTDKLLEERRKVIEQQWQERITNHVERERYALMKIHEELIQLSRSGDAETLHERFEQLVDEAIESGEKPRASADVRDEKGSTLLAIAAQHDHVSVVELLLSRWNEWKGLAQLNASQSNASAQRELARKQELMAKTLKANVNARDCRGWTPVAIAVFHESKRSLRLLLEHGADPKLKNQYNKNAFDFAKDDIDAALNVVKSRAEIRQVLVDWENERHVVLRGDASVSEPPAALAPSTRSKDVPSSKPKRKAATGSKPKASSSKPSGGAAKPKAVKP